MKPLYSITLLVVFCVPLFVGLGDSSVWDSNEAFYVQTPKEMLERSDWLVPYFNGQPRLNKPPLSYWMVGFLYYWLGVSLYWERLLMGLLGAGSVFFTWRIGHRLFDSTTALWAAGMFATTFRFLIISRRLLIDALLLFCLLSTICLFLSWLEKQRSSRLLLAAVMLGLGALAKGPVALLPILLLFLYVLFSGRYQRLFSAPLLPAAIVFLLIASSWYLLVGLFHSWDVVSTFFLRENLGRFTHLELGPSRGPFYYLGVFLADFFPWSILFAAAVVWWFLSRRRIAKDKERESIRLLLLWIAIWIVVFSLSRNKQEYYILPVYPAASIWVSHYLNRGRVPRLLSASAGVALVVAVFLVVWVCYSLFGEGALLWLPALVLLPFPWMLWKRRWTAAIFLLCLTYASGFWLYLEPLEEYRPVKRFAEVVQEQEHQLNEQSRVGYYREASPSLSFYLNRPVLELYDLDQAVKALNSMSPPLYLIMSAPDFDRLQQSVSVRLHIVDAGRDLSLRGRTLLADVAAGRVDPRAWARPIYLVSNHPLPGSSEASQ